MQFNIRKYQIWLLAILSGLLMGMAWPINGFAPLIFISWIPLLMIDTFIRRNKSIFSRGAIVLYSYVSFLIFNLYTTWWVAYSTIEGAILAFILNSLFMALVFGLSHVIDKKLFGNKIGNFTLIFAWLSFEYLHMNWELTWSWLNMGNVFSENPNWVQWYEYTGVLGGSIWVLLINILLFKALLNYIDFKSNTSSKSRTLKGSYIHLILGVLFLFGPILVSYRIRSNLSNADNKSINILIVQPNIEPYEEAYMTSSNMLANNILNLVRKNLQPNTELVICPESSIERSMWESSIEQYPAIDSIRTFISKHQSISFLMGASTRRMLADGEEVLPFAYSFSSSPNQFYYRYNTALFIQNYKPIEFYHKAKLVPGVERMPFGKLLKPLEKFAIDLGGTIGSLGVSTEPKVFDVGSGAAVAPIICYESIYGELVGSFTNSKPSFIAVITNDAWWFDSPGYKQHFSYARLRAIESRRSVIRSANTGISGVIDLKGEVLQTTKFYDKTAINAVIPLNNIWTYYAKNGDYLGRLSVFMISIMFLVFLSRIVIRKKH